MLCKLIALTNYHLRNRRSDDKIIGKFVKSINKSCCMHNDEKDYDEETSIEDINNGIHNISDFK